MTYFIKPKLKQQTSLNMPTILYGLKTPAFPSHTGVCLAGINITRKNKNIYNLHEYVDHDKYNNTQQIKHRTRFNN